MPEVILNCPQCQRQLRVTEELQGRPVKCPACGLTFTVPAGSAEPQPILDVPPATGVPQPGRQPPREMYASEEEHYEEARPWRPHPEGWDGDHADRQRAKSLVLPPAICLLLASSLGLLVDLYEIAVWRAAPDAQMQQLEAFYKAINFQPGPGMQKIADVMVPAHVAFAVLCIVVIVLAIQMMRLRWYPMALVGSLLPMINCGGNCCCLGLPLGIWAFIILLMPGVRNAFYSRSPA